MLAKGFLARCLTRLAMPAILLAGMLVAAPSAQAYAPGTATVISLAHDFETGGWNYSCKFAHWRSGAKVTWHCDLFGYTARGYALLSPNGGSWTPSPTSVTKSFSDRISLGTGNICIRARASSVDGGADSGYQKCRFSL